MAGLEMRFILDACKCNLLIFTNWRYRKRLHVNPHY
jgi:hypothetical protein